MKDLRNSEFMNFRLSKELLEKLDEFARTLEKNIYSGTDYKASRSLAMRMALEDTWIRFFGPKDNPDQIESPHYSEMSKLIPFFKKIKMTEKLDEMSEEEAKNKEEIIKIIKKFG